jgi:hypothetical protein
LNAPPSANWTVRISVSYEVEVSDCLLWMAAMSDCRLLTLGRMRSRHWRNAG